MEAGLSRRFFDVPPRSWQELDALVAQAFSEMGYESCRGHLLQTVRGSLAIDVYAVKRHTPIPTVVLCECKHWARPVEQSVVHGFRSVCADAGAHFGLIISKAGFQSGASATRDATNIHLLDFNSFQETFFSEWRAGVVMKLGELSEPLLPLISYPFIDVPRHVVEKLNGVKPFKKYDVFFGDHSYMTYFADDAALPIRVVDPRGDPTDMRTLAISTYREFFEVAVEGAADARSHFGI